MAMPLTNEMNASIEMLVTRVSPAHETLAQDLSVAAAQLIEAACRARGGDCEASRELAGLVELRASHFSRAFKCVFGASPRAYILRRRI